MLTTTTIIGIATTAIVALIGWIYNQSITITKLSSKLDTLEIVSKEHSSELSALKTSMYGIDNRIDVRVNDALKEMTHFMHELQLTLKELNTTVNYLKEEIKESKTRRN